MMSLARFSSSRHKIGSSPLLSLLHLRSLPLDKLDPVTEMISDVHSKSTYRDEFTTRLPMRKAHFIKWNRDHQDINPKVYNPDFSPHPVQSAKWWDSPPSIGATPLPRNCRQAEETRAIGLRAACTPGARSRTSKKIAQITSTSKMRPTYR